jgi:hypothetical protein
MQTLIRIHELFPSIQFLRTRVSGEKIRKLIELELKKGNTVLLDFEGIQNISQEFADELVGIFTRKYGKQFIKDNIKAVNYGEEIKTILNQVVLSSHKYYLETQSNSKEDKVKGTKEEKKVSVERVVSMLSIATLTDYYYKPKKETLYLYGELDNKSFSISLFPIERKRRKEFYVADQKQYTFSVEKGFLFTKPLLNAMLKGNVRLNINSGLELFTKDDSVNQIDNSREKYDFSGCLLKSYAYVKANKRLYIYGMNPIGKLFSISIPVYDFIQYNKSQYQIMTAHTSFLVFLKRRQQFDKTLVDLLSNPTINLKIVNGKGNLQPVNKLEKKEPNVEKQESNQLARDILNKMLLKVMELKNEYFPLEGFEFALLEKLQDRYKKK